MRTRIALVAALSMLIAAPAMAGDLAFDNGQTAWHSTQCNKPNPPPSVYSAHPETSGNDMNDLISQHNAFVDAAQVYMNCISSEAEHDQAMVSQAIAASAQRDIAQMQDAVSMDAQAVHKNRDND